MSSDSEGYYSEDNSTVSESDEEDSKFDVDLNEDDIKWTSVESDSLRKKVEELSSASWSPSLATFEPNKTAKSCPDTLELASCDINDQIREKLKQAWCIMKKCDSETLKIELSPEQALLAPPILAHCDVFDLAASWRQQGEREELYCLHVLNEVLKTRAMVLRNNERLLQTPELEARDQGFVRPRVLLVVPFKNTAFSIVNTLSRLWKATGGQIHNQGRLMEEFGPSAEGCKAALRRKANNQPEDFIHTFRDNIEDCFRLGIKCTRKSMKLFCDFYSSDIIIASPLGLRFAIDGESFTKTVKVNRFKNKKKRRVRKGDSDFLSSIQMLIIEQTDVILMQNWEHLTHLMEHLNKLPKESHGCDFSRVQSHFLDGMSAHTRQTMVFGEFVFPELNHLIKQFQNVNGKWQRSVESYKGVLKQTKKIAPAISLVTAASLTALPQERLTFFTEVHLPSIPQSARHVCVFIASYLDFVQVRDHFQRADISHSILSEYCSPQEISAARARFFTGETRFLLVTERFHFFKRYRIRGIKKLYFYSLPEHCEYFEQWADMVETEGTEVNIIISPFDYLKTERILGTKRTKYILD